METGKLIHLVSFASLVLATLVLALTLIIAGKISVTL
jgi:hypothetical protein